jgi:hypothetical protein
LSEEPVDEPEVAVGDPGDGGDRFGVGEVLRGEFEAEGSPVVREDEAQLVGTQRPVLVGEADAAVQLPVSPLLLFRWKSAAESWARIRIELARVAHAARRLAGHSLSTRPRAGVEPGRE